MKNTEIEQGKITFSAFGYALISNAMRERYNTQKSRLYEATHAAYRFFATSPSLLNKSPTQKAVHVKRFLGLEDRPIHALTNKSKHRFTVGDTTCRIDAEEIPSVLTMLTNGNGPTLREPKRSDFAGLCDSAAEFDIPCSEAGGLFFDNVNKSVSWYVSGVNAVSNARSSVYFEFFLSVLNEHRWRKNEGGIFFFEHNSKGVWDGRITERFGRKAITLSDLPAQTDLNLRKRALAELNVTLNA
jgi:hypothetical protein